MSKTYTTQQGDMWDAIAFAQMGSCDYVDRLMSANASLLDYFTFPAGIVLTIPELPERRVSTLPPWKQKQVTK